MTSARRPNSSFEALLAGTDQSRNSPVMQDLLAIHAALQEPAQPALSLRNKLKPNPAAGF